MIRVEDAHIGDVDVAHICYGGEGGQLAATQTLARGFMRRGLTTGAVALGPETALVADPHAWANLTTVRRVKVVRRADIASMVQTAKAVRHMRPRVILCHSHRHGPAAVVGQVLSGRSPRMLVIEHQSIPLRTRLDEVRSAIALAFSRGVVLLSRQYQSGYILRHIPLPGTRRQFVIANGVDVETIYPRHRQGGVRSTVVLGMASRLVFTKEQDVILRALAIIRDTPNMPNFEFQIAGEGPTTEKLHDIVTDLGLNDQVSFLVHLEGDSLLEFFMSIDIYVHGSLGEGLSIALLEAAAAGLPIVASDVSGINSVFTDGVDALLVPPTDPTAMAAAIVRVANTEQAKRLGRNARKMVEISFSADATINGYLRALAEIDPKGPWFQAEKGVRRSS